MRNNSTWLIGLWLCLLSLLPGILRAQDALPPCGSAHSAVAPPDTLLYLWQHTELIPEPFVPLPVGFKETRPNVLTDSLGVLRPFWEQLRTATWHHTARRTTDTTAVDSLCIVHIGDSHIRGHIYPRTAGALMRQSFGVVRYVDKGINGAFCQTFTRPQLIDEIAALRPCLLILSFGTNEAHNRRYLPQVHYQHLSELVRLLQNRLPHVPILLTTPPGQYERVGRNRRQRSYRVNPRTALAVQTIHRFADANGCAVWDLYAVAGGARRACLNWQSCKLMRPDRIHYLPAGYELQGQLLHQALVKGYNDYLMMDN